MYKDKLIASLKVGKDILREDKDVVYLPFGSEYSIYMENLEGRDAVVNISIDGQDVLSGEQIVLRTNQATELEGFLKGSKVDARFKFIQKTKQIQEYRGDKIDDGIIRISFRYVKPQPVLTSPPWITTTYYHNPGPILRSSGFNSKDITLTSSYTVSNSVEASYTSAETRSMPLTDEGITVKGSDSDQTFRTVTVGDLEEETHVIVLRLMGATPSATPVEHPVTVKTRKVCVTCGTSNKSSMKFCGQCGTRLD